MAVVSLRAYDHLRDGRPEHVGSYTRTAPDGRADEQAAGWRFDRTSGRPQLDHHCQAEALTHHRDGGGD